MEPRLSLVTLGVENISRARAFYEALGFKAGSASEENVTFLDAGGVVLALFSRASLAEDATVRDSVPGFSGISLAHNARSEAEVNSVLEEAVAAGATLIKPAGKVFWGGYSGYFADLDGHLWEVAYNPYFKLGADGRVALDMTPRTTPR
jgi:predicted lactoylglutathione lyase